MPDDLPPEEYHRQMQDARAQLEVIHGGGGAKKGRLSYGEIIELLLARNASEHSSVSLSRNSKGETQIEVTVRTEPAAGVATIDEAVAKAVAMYEELRGRYPMQSGFVGATPPTPEPAKAPKGA